MLQTNLLTPKEAGELLECTPNSIYALQNLGILTQVVISPNFYFVEAQVQYVKNKGISVGKMLGFE